MPDGAIIPLAVLQRCSDSVPLGRLIKRLGNMQKRFNVMDLINTLMKSTNSEFANLVVDGVVGDNIGFIDTGSYALNALFLDLFLVESHRIKLLHLLALPVLVKHIMRYK